MRTDKHRRHHLRFWLLAGLVVLLPLTTLVSLAIGPVNIPVDRVIGILAGCLGLSDHASYSRAEIVIVTDIRLSRVILAAIVGSGLAMAGATLQGVFRNPLADPGIIGVSGGGAMGAISMIVLGDRLIPPNAYDNFALCAVPLAAVVGAIAMTFLIYRLSLSRGQVDLVAMLLVGIGINALGGALIGWLTFVASGDKLQTLTFWALGSLGKANWNLVIPGMLIIVPSLLILTRYAHALNALLLGESAARHLGVDVQRVKRSLIVLSAAMVGVTVALCGTIGFIALVAPHMVRSAIGPDHRLLIPASGLLGAVLLMFADMGARTFVAPAELPIGILTALLGAPVFLLLLLRRKRLSAGL